jgi:WD40 repeat protein
VGTGMKLLSVPGLGEVLDARGHGGVVTKVAIEKKTGEIGASSSLDGTIRIWDLQKEECAHIFKQPHSGFGVLSVDFHSLSKDWLVSSSIDQTARILDLRSGKVRQTLRGHADVVNAAMFQPHSNTVATVSADKTVSLWDMRSALCIQTFYGHRSALSACAFGGNHASLLATSDLTGQVRYWDLRMCAEAARLEVPGAAINSVAFDSSGSLLAVAAGDGRVRVADLRGALVASGEGHDGEVLDVIWASKTSVVSTGADGTVRLWQ